MRRTTRRQLLTPAGEALYDSCVKWRDNARTGWARAQAFDSQLAGQLRITTPHTLMIGILAPLLGQWATRYPQVEPVVEIDDSSLELLGASIDVAFRVGETHRGNYRQRRIGTLHERLYASEAWLERHPGLPEELLRGDAAPLPLITCPWQQGLTALDVYRGEERLTVPTLTSARCSNVQGALAMVEAGAGVALLPDMALNNRTGVRPLLSEHRSWPIPVYALHSYSGRAPRLVQALIEAMQERW